MILGLRKENYVLKIHAKNQQKYWDSIPPKKKAEHQKQSYKHLTEEEKMIAAQIESFAATLYEKN
jgi:hypothetical protein